MHHDTSTQISNASSVPCIKNTHGSACDNVQSSDNFRVIMPCDQSISYAADKMSGQKRAACSDKVPPAKIVSRGQTLPARIWLRKTTAKKPGVSVKTVQKWITESDREMSTSAWLKYEKADCDYVATLKCSMCIQFNEKLRGMRSLRLGICSWFEEPAIVQLQRSCCYQYAPIANALHNLDDDAALKVKRKFDIAYLIAKHNLAFTKMGPLCKLEERHGVDLGQGYKK